MNEIFDRDFLDQVLRASRDLTDEADNFRRSLGNQFRAFTSDAMSSMRSVKKVFDEINTEADKYDTFQIKQESTMKKINKLVDTRIRFEEKITEINKTVVPQLEKNLELQKETVLQKLDEFETADTLLHTYLAMGAAGQNRADLQKTLVDQAVRELDLAERRQANIESQIEAAGKLTNNMYEQLESIESTIETLEDYNDQWQKAADSLGLIGGLFEKFRHMPGLGKMFKMDEVVDAMKTARMGGKGVFSSLFEGFKMLPKSLMWLTLIGEAVKYIVDLFITGDKYLTQISRQFTVTKSTADDILKTYASMQGVMESNYATIGNIIEAQQQLNSKSVLAFHSTMDVLDAQIQLTKEFGLSEDAALEINKTLSLNNDLGTSGLKTIMRTVQQYNKNNKVLVNTQRVLERVSNVTGELRARFQGNVKNLTNAVIQADRLGISLDQAKAASSGLLDFQSSIESELEAELLLNKSLNFERARMLTLQGRYLEAQEDVMSQLGDYDELSRMNVIQLNAAAKAAGMTTDELVNAAAEQKYLKGEALAFYKQIEGNTVQAKAFKEALAFNQGDLSATTRQIEAQEKFTLAMQKAQDTMVAFAANDGLDRLANMLDKIARAFSTIFGEDNTAVIREQTKKIADLEKELNTKSGADRFDIEKKLAYARNLKQGAELDQSEGTMRDSWITRPFMKTNKDLAREKFKLTPPVQDFIAKGNTITPFRKDDIILGGTKLLDGGNSSNNTNQVVQLLTEVVSLLKAGGDVFLDGQKVGRAQLVGAYKS